jgi:hypothetical protein
MPESLRSRLLRWRFNLFPAYRSTGAWITYIAADYREIRIELPLTWRTRNYVGTMFGGSIYAATDGVYMIMLMKNLGLEYTVWDKAASLRFRKPGRSRLYARFALSQGELDDIRTLAPGSAMERIFRVNLTDREGTVHAEVETSIHIRRRDAAPPC